MALDLHELQLDQGETGVLTATVQPVGTPVLWTSSNEDVATVNNGTVSGVGAGTAIVTAEITVGDVTVSDTCEVTVSAWELVRDLTSEAVWSNSELWVSKEYTETTRQTYVDYSNGELALVKGEGTSTTLYADLRPARADFQHEEGYEYAVNFEWNNAETPNNTFEVTVQRNLSNNTLNTENDAVVFTMSGESGENSVPLVFTSENERLVTIQVRKSAIPENGKCYVAIRIRRRLTV